jgi:hypothetical protein
MLQELSLSKEDLELFFLNRPQGISFPKKALFLFLAYIYIEIEYINNAEYNGTESNQLPLHQNIDFRQMNMEVIFVK